MAKLAITTGAKAAGKKGKAADAFSYNGETKKVKISLSEFYNANKLPKGVLGFSLAKDEAETLLTDECLQIIRDTAKEGKVVDESFNYNSDKKTISINFEERAKTNKIPISLRAEVWEYVFENRGKILNLFPKTGETVEETVEETIEQQ